MAASVEQGGSGHQAVPDDAVDLSDGLLEERDFWSDGEGFSKVARERAFTRTLLIDLVPPEPIKSELAGDGRPAAACTPRPRAGHFFARSPRERGFVAI
jgi:hypothetical protein